MEFADRGIINFVTIFFYCAVFLIVKMFGLVRIHLPECAELMIELQYNF